MVSSKTVEIVVDAVRPGCRSGAAGNAVGSDCGHGIRGHPHVGSGRGTETGEEWPVPAGAGGRAYAGDGWIRVPGSRDKERSRGARHSDDGRLHAGFGAGSDPPGSVGFFAKTHRPRAVEEIARRRRGALRPEAAGEGARRATTEGPGISRHRGKGPRDAGSI